MFIQMHQTSNNNVMRVNPDLRVVLKMDDQSFRLARRGDQGRCTAQ